MSKSRPVENQIEAYFHCAECLAELPKGESPKSYSQIQAGWTKKGFQVWCNRHDMNIMHVDFRGQKMSYSD